ncbi:alpha/beta hydrolase [Dactylosporangium sp. NPDC048998]|uniref:alpha/beta hydrolase n=1 Tax=Dactylosporangium sp. NPDC048998 TaxID=3363976 RepID=UPI00371D325B
MSAWTAGVVTSADGTVIGHRRYGGAGPAVILVHGGGQAAAHLDRLAADLAGDFTVYVPDRRGRGASGPPGDGYGAATERADLAALMDHTGAGLLFGMSSGGLIVLDAARHLPGLRAVAVFEPPLSIDGSTPLGWVARYEQELAAGDVAAAALTVMRGTRTGGPLLRLVPRRLVSRALAAATPGATPAATGPRSGRHRILRLLLWPLRRVNRRRAPVTPGAVSLRDLVATMRYDARLVAESEGTIEAYRGLTVPVLLLGGGRSPRYLRRTLRRLAGVLPDATLSVRRAVGHAAPDDGAELRRFFQRQFVQSRSK